MDNDDWIHEDFCSQIRQYLIKYETKDFPSIIVTNYCRYVNSGVPIWLKNDVQNFEYFYINCNTDYIETNHSLLLYPAFIDILDKYYVDHTKYNKILQDYNGVEFPILLTIDNKHIASNSYILDNNNNVITKKQLEESIHMAKFVDNYDELIPKYFWQYIEKMRILYNSLEINKDALKNNIEGFNNNALM
jgi:hypothetical protein